MSQHLRILVVEDSEDDAQLLLRELKRGGLQVVSECVENAEAFLEALKNHKWDLVISDFSLPQFSAPQALELLQASGLDLPFIIVSGTIGEETAVSALKAGAHDFLVKGSMARLIPAIQREVRDAETRRKRKEADRALHESNARFRSLFENTPVAIWEEDFSAVKAYLDNLRDAQIVDLEKYLDDHPNVVSACLGLVKIIDVNQMALNLFEAKDKAELITSLEKIFDAERLDTFKRELITIIKGQQRLEMDVLVKTLGGQQRDVTLIWAVVPGHEETYSIVLVSLVDITERKQRERELNAIASVSIALRAVQSVDELVTRLLDESLKLIGASTGSIWLNDALNGKISQVHQRGAEDFKPLPVSFGQGIVGKAMELGVPIVAREFKNSSFITEENRERIPANMGGICLPLRAAQQAVGAMFINVFLPRELTGGELRILNALTEIGGDAIHRMQLHETTLRQVDRLEALHKIEMAISGSLDLRVTLSVVLDQAIKQLEIDAADVLLVERGTGRLKFEAGRGFHTNGIEASDLRLGEGFAGQAALDQQILQVDDLIANKDAFVRYNLLADEKFVSYYGVPLVSKGEIKGVLEIFHRSTLKPSLEWLNFLDALGRETGIAIDDALLFEDLQRSNFDLKIAYDATIEGWSYALDLRDRETEGHTLRVTEITIQLAQAMGLSQDQILHMRRGALLHDIGKMGVPDHILLKQSQLTEQEWEIMSKHPVYAYDMLRRIPYLHRALEIPYSHHEKWDGTGYPRGLSGNQIPLVARIFSVIDVWDALTSDRPYRPGWSKEKAIEYIRKQSGKHFDPKVVEVFLQESFLKDLLSRDAYLHHRSFTQHK
ncbi:MAG: HD domain-containing phosphohydrolase [Anaerolineales bacterium]